MLSKWVPWDFFKHNPNIIDQNSRGLFGIEVFDSFLEKMVTFKLKSNGQKFNVVVGSELTPDWLISKFQELDFFSFNQEIQTETTNHWLVLNAEDIPNESKKLILAKAIDFSSHVLVLSFAKRNSFFDDLGKIDEYQCLKMEEYKFWDTPKYLSFLAEQMAMNIDSSVSQYILDSVPNTTQEFVQVLSKMRRFNQTWTNSQKQKGLLRELVSKTRVDQFALASKFSQRNKPFFYKSLIETELDFDSLKSLFNFMQGHLLKLYDPSYMYKKPRMTKYDKEVDAHSKLWKKADLLLAVKQFSDFEILAKQKSDLLLTEMRSEYFEAL